VGIVEVTMAPMGVWPRAVVGVTCGLQVQRLEAHPLSSTTERYLEAIHVAVEILEGRGPYADAQKAAAAADLERIIPLVEELGALYDVLARLATETGEPLTRWPAPHPHEDCVLVTRSRLREWHEHLTAEAARLKALAVSEGNEGGERG